MEPREPRQVRKEAAISDAHRVPVPVLLPMTAEKKGYLSIARKHRPQLFSEVVYQNHVVTILQNSLRSGKIHSCYLFSGMRGVGKTSLARLFAKALNCLEGPGEEPCNRCENCLEISAGRFPDVLEIDGASNRGIDQVRELRESVKYKPLKGRYKVIIIDEVHMLTNEAFNALLKTLEEPPPSAVFILATTEFQKVLPTVVSRSILLDLRRIPFQEIQKQLEEICRKEGIEASPWALSRLAEASDGSLRDGLSLFEQLASYGDGRIDDGDLSTVLGLVGEELKEDLLRALLKGDKEAIFTLVERLFQEGDDLQGFYRQLFDYLRDLLFFLETGKEEKSFTPRQRALFEEVKGQADPLTVLRWINHLEKNDYTLKKSFHKRYLLELLLLNLVYLREAVEVESLLKKRHTLSVPADNSAVSAPEGHPATVSAAPRTGHQEEGEVSGEGVLRELQELFAKEPGLLSASLSGVTDLKIEKERVLLTVARNRLSSLQTLERQKEALVEGFKKILKKSVRVDIVAAGEAMKTPRELLQEDQRVKSFLEVFQGEVIDKNQGGETR